MPIIRSNAIRIKRFRELKADLRTHRSRLLVGIDIAKAQHVAQVRLAHTRILDKHLGVPNTQAGFAAFWAHLERRQGETGCPEIVCAVEPTGTYHQALATFLEGHGVDVVFVCNAVAALNRRTLDRTWGKSDPKDAHNLCDLLERGRVLFYSLPNERVAALRRLVRLLRHARVDLAACKARFRNTLLPTLGPAGEPLPPALVASLPAPLQVLLPAAERQALPAVGAVLPAALAFECTDLAARLVSVRTRIARIAAELVAVASPLPAYRLLLSIPGIGPTLAAILLAELGDSAWDQQVQPAPQARGAGHRPPGVRAVDRDGADLPLRAPAPALGALPSGPRDRAHAVRTRLAGRHAREAPRGPPRLLQGQRRTRREAPPARLGGLAERAPLRPGAGGARARGGRQPPRAGGRGEAGVTGWRGRTHRPRDSGEAARECNVEAPRGDLGRDTGAPLPLPQLGLGRQGARGSRDAA